MGVKKKRFAESALLHIVIVFITLLCVLPILWMCLIAVKPASESISGFHSVLVESPTMANFERLFEMIPVLQNTFNSVFTAILGTVTSLFFCSLGRLCVCKVFVSGKKCAVLFCDRHDAGAA